MIITDFCQKSIGRSFFQTDCVKKPLLKNRRGFLAPPVGLEPTTHGLTVRCSTDWAKGEYKCWRYLSSRPVTRQVLSAQMSLTSVFGMGTGGPSSQSTPTIFHSRVPPETSSIILRFSRLSSAFFLGDPSGIRTHVNGVRGRCLNHLTMGPWVHLHGLKPETHWLRVIHVTVKSTSHCATTFIKALIH